VEQGKPLVEKGYLTKQVFDQRVTKAGVAEAALHAAEAQREAAQSQIKNAQAEVERFQAILVDLTLVSPRSGRVQYLIHRAGEVVDAGTRILTILDLNDVYMTIYLPDAQAGKLALGDEARMVLDPFAQYVVPATVSFVATDAQFTPKSVETAEDRGSKVLLHAGGQTASMKRKAFATDKRRIARGSCGYCNFSRLLCAAHSGESNYCGSASK
jgi:HlyD family secretion protein